MVEATGGDAAVAQAWFARRLGLPYTVVMPGERSEARARVVEELGGECRFVTPPLAIYDAALRIDGHFLDQFGRAAEHDLADELFTQVRPDWVVTGASDRHAVAHRGHRATAHRARVPARPGRPGRSRAGRGRCGGGPAHLREVTGLPVGGSSGTALWAALELVERMRAKGETGTVVSLIGDAAERHLATYHREEWAAGKGLDVGQYAAELRRRAGV